MGRTGLAEVDPAELGPVVVACWDAFLAVAAAPSTDLTRPSRLRGWSGADTCIHLGQWPDNQPMAGLLASARAGGGGAPGEPDRMNSSLVAAHRSESPARILASVRDARDTVADWFAGSEPAELGRAVSRSTVGPLPVLSLVHAATYELAVHALDLAPCGAPTPDPILLDRGLAALQDVTGALCSRLGLSASITAQGPRYGWRLDSGAAGWTTVRTAAGPFAGCGVRGSVEDMLDTSAGRTNLGQLLLTRRLVVQDLPAFMHLAPLLQEVPGLPGGAALKAAVAGLGRVTRLLHLSR